MKLMLCFTFYPIIVREEAREKEEAEYNEKIRKLQEQEAKQAAR